MTSCPDQADQQQQPQSPTQQLFAAHLASQQQQQQPQESIPSPSRQQSRLGSTLHTGCSVAGSQKAAADACEAAADPKVSSAFVCSEAFTDNTHCLYVSPTNERPLRCSLQEVRASSAGVHHKQQQQQQQQQPASLEEQLSVVQSELAGSQQQAAELSSRLAAAEADREALQEQLDHLEVKVSLCV
jgi:hypothetical protein